MLTISESFNIIRDKDYSISVLNDKFYGGIIFKSGDYYYGIYCNGSNGKENCILNSMKEVVNYLEDIKEDWDYCNICDSYFDITDDVYYWLFIFK